MTVRRRRWPRDETVAPWVTMVVVLALWWAGAHLLGRSPLSEPPASASPASESSDSVPAVRDGSHLVAATDRPSVERSAPGVEPESSSPRPEGAATLGGLLLPVSGVDTSALRASFDEARGSGRRHEAIDILAPRGTAVFAAADGRVAKLFTSAAGGLTIYQFDPTEEYALYYAHLDGYAADLTEGQRLVRGQTIGYVGTTGNAPPGTPHLHFAIFKLGPEKRWWQGTAVDPFPLLGGSG